MRKVPRHISDRDFQLMENRKARRVQVICAVIPALGAIVAALIEKVL